MPETLERTPLLEWRKKKATDLRGIERREFAVAGLEIREKDSDTWIISGWASVTERYYEVGFYEERIRIQAFKRTLSESPDVQFLVNHTDLPLARTLSGTLGLEERTVPDAEGKTGLWFEAEVDKLDPDAQRLERKIRRGDINAASFAFQVTDQEWSDDYTKRDIKGLSMHRGDVSVVNQGANPYATVSVRSQDASLALADLGNEVIVSALVEWRDYTLLPRERREGKTLSAATREVLSNVAGMIDDAGGLLDDLLAVSNPETDDGEATTVERSIQNEKGLCAAIRGASALVRPVRMSAALRSSSAPASSGCQA
jgi:HK97 family phage prohead protease